MNKTTDQNIKTEDKKALPGFILTVLGGAVLGFVSYFAITAIHLFVSDTSFFTTLCNSFSAFLPYSIFVCMAIFALPCIFILHKASKAFAGWDGEEESTPDFVEISTSKVIMLSNISYILSLLFFPLGTILTEFESSYAKTTGLLFISFLLSILFTILLQRTAVNLQKKLNPEKHGSVFDLHFHKKWENSCDEAEQKRIGTASYASFKTVMITCMLLWVLTILLSTVITVSIFSYLLLAVISLAAIISFCVTDIRAIQKKHK